MPISLDISTKDFLAVWGACLSTVLGGLKVYEYWRDRFRIEVDYEFIDDPIEGNKLTIRNLTSRPMTIAYRELLFGRKWLFFSKLQEIPFTDEPAHDVTIPPHSSQSIRYREQSHFLVNRGSLSGTTLFLKLWIAGRRPLLVKVYKNAA